METLLQNMKTKLWNGQKMDLTKVYVYTSTFQKVGITGINRCAEPPRGPRG